MPLLQRDAYTSPTVNSASTKKETRPEAADYGRSNPRNQRRIDFLRSTRLWIIASVAATGEDRGMTTDRTELEGHDTVVRGSAMPFTDDPYHRPGYLDVWAGSAARQHQPDGADA